MATLSSIAARMVVEGVRQIGSGVREYLRDQRKAATAKKPEPRPSLLHDALINLGFKEQEVRAALASPEVKQTAHAPLGDQVRMALKVLTGKRV